MHFLLTSFCPFGSIDINTSHLLMNNIKDKNCTKLLLPVTLNESFEKLNDVLSKDKFDFIILLGMASNRQLLSIEKVAYNNLDFKIPDNNGILIKDQKIVNNNILNINSSIDIEKILKELNTNLIYKSTDPGRYICNYIYFKTLYHYPNIPCIFIHIPLFHNLITLDNSTTILEQIINYLKRAC